MNETDVSEYFKKQIQADNQLSDVVSAIQTLIRVVELCEANTIQELIEHIKKCMKVLEKEAADHNSVTSVRSGCEQFLQLITRGADGLECSTMKETKNVLLQRGKAFESRMVDFRSKIAHLSVPFIGDGAKILTHSISRVILAALKEAAQTNKYFHVYVTASSSSPQGLTGSEMCKELSTAGITNTLVADAAIGYVMETVDMVMVGAECVVESGGVINRIGTYTLGMCAKQLGKPVYVLAESFKFVRLYPLNQQDVPDYFKYSQSQNGSQSRHPQVDYTPPNYITLLFTDLGILTPSAVSDELIKLYL